MTEKIESMINASLEKVRSLLSAKMDDTAKDVFIEKLKSRFYEASIEAENKAEAETELKYKGYLSADELAAKIMESRTETAEQEKKLKEKVAMFESAGLEITAFRKSMILSLIEKSDDNGIENYLLDLLLFEKGKTRIKDHGSPALQNSSGGNGKDTDGAF